MKKRKVAVTTGTRAEYGILRPILDGIKISKKLELILIVTGSHFSKKHGLLCSGGSFFKTDIFYFFV